MAVMLEPLREGRERAGAHRRLLPVHHKELELGLAHKTNVNNAAHARVLGGEGGSCERSSAHARRQMRFNRRGHRAGRVADPAQRPTGAPVECSARKCNVLPP